MMLCFFDLPRELRDMIYMEVLIDIRKRPSLRDTETEVGWNKSDSGGGGGEGGDYECVFSAQRAPNTCANFLVCSRQIYLEMGRTIESARRDGLLAARMDCIAKDETHYFSWLSIPLVKTTQGARRGGGGKKATVRPGWATRYLTARHRALVGSHGGEACRTSTATTSTTTATTTLLDQLCIDIRLFGDQSPTPAQAQEATRRNGTCWAICAALEHVFQHGDPETICSSSSSRDYQNHVSINELILNVLWPPHHSTPSSCEAVTQQSTTATTTTSSDALSETEAEKATRLARVVAKELADVWNKLWSNDEFKARYYHALWAHIQRVRICVDGKTFRVRDLRAELERGWAARRKTEMRLR